MDSNKTQMLEIGAPAQTSCGPDQRLDKFRNRMPRKRGHVGPDIVVYPDLPGCQANYGHQRTASGETILVLMWGDI